MGAGMWHVFLRHVSLMVSVVMIVLNIQDAVMFIMLMSHMIWMIGLGLFIGVELVLDRILTPAPREASHVVNSMQQHGILVSTDGPHHNVIKIKPPMCFTKENVDTLVNAMDEILQTMHITPGWNTEEDARISRL